LWRPMAGAEKPRRGPVAQPQTLLQQPLLQAGDGKRTQRQHWRKLKQLAPANLPEFLFIHFAIVYFAIIALHELTLTDGLGPRSRLPGLPLRSIGLAGCLLPQGRPRFRSYG